MQNVNTVRGRKAIAAPDPQRLEIDRIRQKHFSEQRAKARARAADEAAARAAEVAAATPPPADASQPQPGLTDSDQVAGTTTTNGRVDIPDTWRDLEWPKLRSLATTLGRGTITSRIDAVTAITAELAERKDSEKLI